MMACQSHQSTASPAVPQSDTAPAATAAPDPFATAEARSRAPVEDLGRRTRAPVLVQHATVMTAAGKRFDPGFVLMENGVITGVGEGDGPRQPPAGTVVVDARGRFVTPGIVDPHSHMGVYPVPRTSGHDDGNEMTDPVTASVRAEDAFWPQDPAIERAVAGGVTTIAVLPGSGNLIGGRGVVLHLTPQRGTRAMRLPGAPEILKMACGENPIRIYRNQKRAPSSRMGAVRAVRDVFLRAQKYARDWDDWLKRTREPKADKKKGEDKPDKPPDRDIGLETLALVLRGDILVQWHCYQADDMLSALQVADEFGFKVRAFHHALEAYKIRDVLARKGVAVVTFDDWWGFKMEAYDGIPENLALVSEAGVRTALPSAAPFAVPMRKRAAGKALAAGRAAGGDLDADDAIKWMTANPAWVLGIDSQKSERWSSGKRADVVVWSTKTR